MRSKLFSSLGALALASGLSNATLAAPPQVVCHDESVAGLGGFNNQAACPVNFGASGGGYELVTPDFSQLLGASVSESMPLLSGITPVGWQVIGSNLTTLTGKIRVCVMCVPK